MPRFFWFVVAAIGTGLILLIVNHESGSTLGIRNDMFAQSLYLGIWAAVLATAILASRIALGEILRNVAIWLLICLTLTAGYQYRYELQDIASRVTAGLIPSSPLSVVTDGGVAVILEKQRNGHFQVRGLVSGTTVEFLIDTGATATVLTAADARRVGIELGSLNFNVPVSTANGVARAARANVDEIRIGEISRRRMPLLVAEPGQLEISLLGMNFLGTLSGFDVRGDRLVLHD